MKTLFGKSIFARIFIINIVIIVVCLTILGATQMVLIDHFISNQLEKNLGKNGDSIAMLIENNVSRDNLQSIINGLARSTGSQILVVDRSNQVILGTEDGEILPYLPRYVDEQYTRDVFEGEKKRVIGTMGGMFQETMFTLQVPILSRGNEPVGAVLISTPVPEKRRMTAELVQLLLLSAMGVLLVSFCLSYMLSKRFSKPIKSIQASARAFSRGKFDARVGDIATDSQVAEIRELAEAFNDMACELEKVEETRKSFISDVSHELRTPMTTIGGFVQGMMDGTIPPEKHKEYLQIVHDEIARLSRLVTAFLDVSKRDERGGIQKTDFDINEEVRLTVIGMEQRISEKEIRVSLSFPSDSCYVYADRDGIRQVLTNLLDNAVKFTPQGGEIRVSVAAVQQEVCISVYNTGSGIPQEKQAMLFERFYKADSSRSENREGSGIGLYLVKKIIRSHGKQISVRSQEGSFAEFTFRLDRGGHPKAEKRRHE